ncbi:MAG: DUF4249 domain-containing protein [Bacteroidia bacterium]|nr:DUF4249 domain-containing protein [Bacteroidia bacterium]
MLKDSTIKSPKLAARSPKLKKSSQLAACSLWLFLLYSCGQPPVIDLDLGEYENKLVVEAYLKPDKKARVLLTESQSYFAPVDFPVIQQATVVLSYADVTDTLNYDPVNFDYVGKKVKLYYDTDYFLRVEDGAGRVVTSVTHFEPTVPIDSLQSFNDGKDEARIITNFTDPAASGNHYRITITSDSSKNWSRSFSDALANGQEVAISSSYKFPNHDQVKVRLYALTRAHYDFLVSVSTARRSAGSPIAEPAPVISNIEGGLGIFTTLNWTLDSLSVEF